MCDECIWEAPHLYPEERQALEEHIAKLMKEQYEGENPISNDSGLQS